MRKSTLGENVRQGAIGVRVMQSLVESTLDAQQVIELIFPDVRQENGAVLLSWSAKPGRQYSVYSISNRVPRSLSFEAGPFAPAKGKLDLCWTDPHGIRDPKAYVVEVYFL